MRLSWSAPPAAPAESSVDCCPCDMLLGAPDNPGLVVVVAPGGFGDDDELLLPPPSGNVDLSGVIGLSRPVERPSSLNVLPLPSLELHIELSESELDAAA